MNNLTKLLVASWLACPFIVQATEREIILSSSQMYTYQAQNGGIRDLYDKIGTDDSDVSKHLNGSTNKILGEIALVKPYKSPFTRENFKHMAAVGASLGIGEIVFEFGIKQLFKDSYGTHHIMPLLITSNILFDLFTATGGFYAYKQWFKSPENEDED